MRAVRRRARRTLPVLGVRGDGPSGATIAVPPQCEPPATVVIRATPLQLAGTEEASLRPRRSAATTSCPLRAPNTCPRVPLPSLLAGAVYHPFILNGERPVTTGHRTTYTACLVNSRRHGNDDKNVEGHSVLVEVESVVSLYWACAAIPSSTCVGGFSKPVVKTRNN